MGGESNSWTGLTRRSDLAAIALVCVVGLMLAAGTYAVLHGRAKGIERQRFERDAAHVSALFTSSVERHVGSLAAIRAFVSASQHLSRWEFSAFANQTLPENPGFRSVLWVPEVPAQQRAAYEAEFQRDGLFGLKIRELDASGKLKTADKRPLYLPISYFEPFERNGVLIGLDLSTAPAYQALFDTARQNSAAAASALLSRTPLNGTGAATVAIAFPLGAKSPDDNGNALSADLLKGFVLGVLQLDRLLANARANSPSAFELGIAYQDGKNDSTVVAADNPIMGGSISLSDWLAGGEFSRQVPFEIAGQPFTLALRSASSAPVFDRLVEPLAGALLILTLAGLLAQHLYAQARQKRAIERAVVSRTFELRNANAALQEEIGQRRSIETALRLAKERAEIASRTKSEFLATMSHELRTPLNAIIGFSSLLARSGGEGLGERFEEYVEEIHEGGIRLLSMVNELLELSQMDAGRVQLDDETINLEELLETVVHKLSAMSKTADVNVRTLLPDRLPLLRGDERKIQKAFSALVSNAIKFTLSGGRIEITAREGVDGSLSIIVTDNGIGIPAGQESRIFEPFVQLNSSLTRSHDGVGLGLALVKRIVDLHGATISVESKAGSGATITVGFPASRVIRSSEVA
ncbi:MAG: ATP-binding protein [Alphaproteobacteria bacterium]